jgi:hypothetical protein
MGRAENGRPGSGMKWRGMVELTGSDSVIRSREVSAGGSNAGECSAATVGLTLADAKRTLVGLQDHLVRAQADEYCRQRRGCSHCGSQRPLKDVRTRRLLSLFGTVEVGAPRFFPASVRRPAVTRSLPSPEIMPDRCTPEYERVIAKMGSLLGPPRNWGSSGDRRWRGYVVRWIKLLSKVETERTIVDGTTNLKQEVRAAW